MQLVFACYRDSVAIFFTTLYPWNKLRQDKQATGLGIPIKVETNGCLTHVWFNVLMQFMQVKKVLQDIQNIQDRESMQDIKRTQSMKIMEIMQ